MVWTLKHSEALFQHTHITYTCAQIIPWCGIVHSVLCIATMLIVIVLCLIHHYNLEPVIYMILELHHIFVVFLAVRLVLVSDSLVVTGR